MAKKQTTTTAKPTKVSAQKTKTAKRETLDATAPLTMKQDEKPATKKVAAQQGQKKSDTRKACASKQTCAKTTKSSVKKETVAKDTQAAPSNQAVTLTTEQPSVSKVTAKKAASTKKTTKATAKQSIAKSSAKASKTKVSKSKKADSESKTTITKQAKMAAYEALSLEECIALMHQMNVTYSYEDYYHMLMEEGDLKQLAAKIDTDHQVSALKSTYAKDGCDTDLILVTINKVADTMDVKAADYKQLKQDVAKAVAFTMGESDEENAAAYLDEFKVAEKLLMIGQRKEMDQTTALSALIDADTVAFFHHFFDFAYALLPHWQYSDVKFYEDFAYAILSQYNDLFEQDQMRIQMDVADLYIAHGDYAHGDELYHYILRDNQIKDYIYYRYAAVYQSIDYNKAKAIAYSSRQYIDERYTYYAQIQAIIDQE